MGRVVRHLSLAAIMMAIVLEAGFRDTCEAQRTTTSSNVSGEAPSAASGLSVRHIDEHLVADRFSISPHYSRRLTAQLKVVGAYELSSPPGLKLVRAWSPGYLPVAILFSDGICRTFEADYDGTLKNGRISPTCAFNLPADSVDPNTRREGLRLVSSAWGFRAWADDQGRRTIVTRSGRPTDEPLLEVGMAVTSFMAMVDPHGVGSDMTFVGTIDGKTMIVTVEVVL